MRLEVAIIPCPHNAQLSFLFQIGAISRIIDIEKIRFKTKFLFQIGAIRRVLPPIIKTTEVVFLFQIGAIRRSGWHVHTNTDSYFYSKLVRLEAIRTAALGSPYMISIPNWCD